MSATGGKKRRIKLKPGSCAVVKGFKTYDGEKWDHHDYEVCMTKSGLTTRRMGTYPEDNDKDATP